MSDRAELAKQAGKPEKTKAVKQGKENAKYFHISTTEVEPNLMTSSLNIVGSRTAVYVMSK